MKKTEQRSSAATAVLDGSSRADNQVDPYEEALVCLHESGVIYCLLRDNPDRLSDLTDLDVLIHPKQRQVAFAALRRAGFLPKRDRKLRKKWVFVQYRNGRFFTLDVHGALVQGGIEYMDYKLALSRRDQAQAFPVLKAEDRFVHILLHNLLGKPKLQDKHLIALDALRRAKLDSAHIEDQTSKYGTQAAVRAALEDLKGLAKDAKRWKKLRSSTRSRLLRTPANRFGAWWYRNAERFRWRRRAIVLALLGPDGCGKSTLVETLESLLAHSPLNARCVYMGSWGHDHLPMRLTRRLIPPRLSYGRMFAHSMGRNVALSPSEKAHLRERNPGWLSLAFAAVRYGIKSFFFHAGLLTEMTYRYWRFIKRCSRPIVISDRYIYDLEFRQGKVPFTYGESIRKWIFRVFPKPDGILYLSAPYSVVQARKPQLNHEQFVTMDKGFRRLLKPYSPLELFTDVPSDEVARGFVERYWEHLLDRVNQRA